MLENIFNWLYVYVKYGNMGNVMNEYVSLFRSQCYENFDHVKGVLTRTYILSHFEWMNEAKESEWKGEFCGEHSSWLRWSV